MRKLVVSGAQRLSALICLASAYQFAVSNFAVTWLLVTVAAGFVVATAPSQWHGPQDQPRVLPWPSSHHLLRNLIPGWLLMTLAGVLELMRISPRVALWIWLTGLAWLLVGAHRLSPQRGARMSSPSRRAAWLCGVLIVAFAAAVRLWEIDTVPRYVHCDEGSTAIWEQRIFSDPNYDWLGMRPGEPLSLNGVATGLGVWVGGFNLGAARVPNALLGILSVVLLFDGLRRVSSLQLATAAAVLLAANHCHLAFSRIASDYISTAFLVSLIFAILSRLWVTPSYLSAVFLGLVVAVGVQTYLASLLLLPLVVAIVTVLVALHPSRRRVLLAPLLLCAISWGTASAPFGATLGKNRDTNFGRAQALNIFSEHKMEQLKREVYHTDSAVAVVAHQAWNSLLGFHVGYDTQPEYGSAVPMADRYTAALMVPGAVFALLGLRQFLTLNVFAFTAGYLLFGLGMQWAPGFNRTTGALPLGMVLPAIALVQCCGTLWNGRNWLTRSARNLSIAAVVALCIVANLNYYFVDYKWSRLRGDASSEAAWVTRLYYRQYTVHLVNWPLPGPEGQTLILGNLPIRRHKQPDSLVYVNTVPATGSDLFIMGTEDQKARDALLARFPEARVELWSRDPAGPNLTLVFVGQPRANPKSGSG